MASGGKSIEVKVGALILFSMVLLGGFIVVMGGLSVARVYSLFIDFDNPSGLQIGAPVKIAGVKVGKVEDLEFRGGKADPDVKWTALVRVRISVEDKVRSAIHDDAKFVITTNGVLGEPFIAIQPGNVDKPVLAENSKRQGQDPPRLDVFLAEASDILHIAHEALTSDKGLVHDLGQHGLSLVKGLDEVVAENRGSLGNIVKNTETMTKDGITLIDSAKEKIDGPQLRRIMNNVDVTMSSVATETGPLLKETRGLIAKVDTISSDVLGPEERAKLKRSLTQLEQTLTTVNKTTTDVQAVVEHVKAGKGTVGAFLMDEEIYDDLQEMLRDLKHNPWKLFWRE
jgi:phospholipid/cholesterol/gamma-HCH transport system substrate-binding protein